MNRLRFALRAVLLLAFAPSRFIEVATEHDIAREFETNAQLRDRYPDRRLPAGEQRPYRELVQKRTTNIRRSFRTGFLVVAGTVLAGWASGAIAYRAFGPASQAFVVGLQWAGGAILLGATLSVLGWEIQSYKGRTLPEQVNRWLYRGLYMLGTYLLILSASWGP